MAKYVISFSKKGYAKFTSHLDMLRLFKRSFRRVKVDLKYSEGFNPHPKMGFAQPLSLGYLADDELIEFESGKNLGPGLIPVLAKCMPIGIELNRIGILPEGRKTLAAIVESAEYTVYIPRAYYSIDAEKTLSDYLAQDSIVSQKKQKKTKKLVDVEIRNKIRSMNISCDDNYKLVLKMELDCGSNSNLSPELVINTFLSFAGIDCKRSEIEVKRNKLKLPLDYDIYWM